MNDCGRKLSNYFMKINTRPDRVNRKITSALLYAITAAFLQISELC